MPPCEPTVRHRVAFSLIPVDPDKSSHRTARLEKAANYRQRFAVLQYKTTAVGGT